MTTPLISKPGLTSASVLAIPKDWSASWFRSIISSLLQGGDIRNATSPTGTIKIGGTIASPYGTIDLNTGATITFTGNIIISPTAGTGLTVNATTGSPGSVFNGSSNSSAIVVNGNAANAGAPGSGSAALIFGAGGGEFFSIGGSSTLSSYIGLYSGNPASGANVGFIGYGNGILTGGALTDLIIRGAGTVKLAAGGNHLNVSLTSTTIGVLGAAGVAQLAGWGTPVGNTVVASYNITDAGGANSNTNKAVAQIIATLKAYGLFAT